jgi:hypothetical protein
MTDEDKKISSIYQEASSTEPPAHLDNSILAASRDAVERGPRAKSPFSGGWPVPASIAAVVIIAVIIVPVIMHEGAHKERMPAATIADTHKKSAADNEMKAPGKLKVQGFNRPEKSKAPPVRLMQSPSSFDQPKNDLLMEEQVEAEAPAEARPAFSTYEMDSLSSGAEAGRMNKQTEPADAMREKKAIATQGLMKRESEKRIRSAENWLIYIHKLVAANKIEIAKSELKEFKTFYPDHAIDPDLIYLLEP